MKTKLSILIITISLFLVFQSSAQNPIGKWKFISEINKYEGQKFDSHRALLSTKPSNAKIFKKNYIQNRFGL